MARLLTRKRAKWAQNCDIWRRLLLSDDSERIVMNDEMNQAGRLAMRREGPNWMNGRVTHEG